jgi:hypothetical protein
MIFVLGFLMFFKLVLSNLKGILLKLINYFAMTKLYLFALLELTKSNCFDEKEKKFQFPYFNFNEDFKSTSNEEKILLVSDVIELSGLSVIESNVVLIENFSKLIKRIYNEIKGNINFWDNLHAYSYEFLVYISRMKINLLCVFDSESTITVQYSNYTF